MKSRYIASKTESEKIAIRIAREEVERQKKDFCPKCEQRMEMQTIAVMCKVLSAQFGFGKKRLKELIDGAEGIGTYLNQTGCDYQICIDWLKDEMGIDLNEQT